MSEKRVPYEERVRQATAMLRIYDALSFSELCHFLGIGNRGHPIEGMLRDNTLAKTIYYNVILYHLPNTPQEVVDRIWGERYIPAHPQSQLKARRLNQTLKRERLRKKYEERVDEITVLLKINTAMSFSDIYRNLKLFLRGGNYSPLLKMLRDHSVKRTVYPNVTLYSLPDVPEEEIKMIWSRNYKPAKSPSFLRTQRKNRLEKKMKTV